jgi:putative transposase
MGRPPRAAEGGLIYHTLNRANAGLTIFEGGDDYGAFLRVLAEALARHRVGLLAYCVMPNHFHLVVRPGADGELSRFMRWLSLTHTQRWHAHRKSAGAGHLYQGRFKSFPVQDDAHLYTVCRYVERNPLRAGLVKRAEEWPWGSLRLGAAPPDGAPALPLTPWPVARPADWLKRVNTPMKPDEEAAVLRSIQRGQPFGGPDWAEDAARRLGLESTFRPVGRPRKIRENGS